jgi:predicted nucleic-acid-binding protein
MLAIDTNVLVRLITDDDPVQAARVRRLIEQCAAANETVFLSLLVVLETEWVLRSRYALDKARIRQTFQALLDTDEIMIEDESVVEEALARWDNSAAGFADCLIGACHQQRGCRATATFDAKAARLRGFALV